MEQSTFLFDNSIESEDSANVIINQLWPFLNDIQSFMDLGCGLGGWSQALEKKGIEDFLMVDHPSLEKQKLLVKNKNNFLPINLDKELPKLQKKDLTVCIEVLEHFENKRSIQILDFICATSDLILFSAAVPGQKGVGHINEQNHGYWHQQFSERGFKYYDGFKIELFPHINKVKFYHIQNIFLYFKPELFPEIKALPNITGSNFEIRSLQILDKPLNFSELISQIPKSLVRSIRYRFSK